MPTVPTVRAAIAAAQRRANRTRSASISVVPPAEDDDEYLPELAAIAASILYRSPLPSLEGRPVYILNAAAFPDAYEVDYDTLLAYVLARLPGEDELISGADYEVVFFAGGTPDNATAEKKQGPSTGWYLQAYHVLSRALRKKLQKLYIVHPRTWVRVLISVFGTIVSPKFRRKIVHVNSLSQLALHIPIEKLLIPPSAYLHDRKVSPDVFAPFVTGRRAFGVKHPLPRDINTGKRRLPRVLRETTSFITLPDIITTEGLFRIPPHNTLSGVLKEAYDRGQQYIIWKEKDATYFQPGIDTALVDEVRLEDAYGVHLAASLIKMWYRELREPIFPESSYPAVRERYGDSNVQITPEDIVDLILPASNSSVLTSIAREILTRHLLPLLSLVASHEAENKMNSENLAICFSMCLVCGSNQMEDGRMSAVIKRILQAAIAMWPQLRTGLDIDPMAFRADIEPPADFTQYEDVLEDVRPKVASHELDSVDQDHKIMMVDPDTSPSASPEGAAPTLPPRRSRAASLKKALTPHITVEMPPMPKIDFPSIPKRKPAPPPMHADPPPTPTHFDEEATPVATEPPRYSTVFDVDGKSLHVDSPSSYVPVDGFGPPQRANFSFYGDEKKVPSQPEPSDLNPMAAVPKRKAVVGSSTEDTKAQTTPEPSRKASETNALLARMAAQQAANNIAQRITVKAPPRTSSNQNDMINSAPAASEGVSNEGNTTYRKPSWPASQSQQPSNIQSLARPVHLQPRHAQTLPIITTGGQDGNTSLQTPSLPRPRAPSPGLLKRMTSMETTHQQYQLHKQQNQQADALSTPQHKSPSSSPLSPSASERQTEKSLRPRPLNLRQTSVDDLRRLYEERANTAQNLAGVARRASNRS